MSGQKHRKPVFGTKLHNNAPKKEARLRVQSGRGLVKNKNLGFVQKRTRNVNSPPLPAGELADGSVHKITEIEKFRKLRKSFFERFSVDAVQCGSTAEVFPNGQCLIQHGILKNNAELSGNVLKIPLRIHAQNRDAAAVPAELPRDYGDGCGFARSVNTEKGKKFTSAYTERKVSNGLYLSESFIQSVNADDLALGRSEVFTAQVVILCVTH